jgi:outer membrane protein assembly factor BamB
VVAGDLVAVIDDDGWLRGLDRATGAERWAIAVEPDQHATPVIREGVVYAADGVSLHAVEAATGTELWTEFGGMAGEPLVDGTTLVLLTLERGAVAVDVGGARALELWSYLPEEIAFGAGTLLTPASSGGLVYLVAPALRGGPGSVYAVDASTGTEAWRRDDLGAVTAPVVADGRLIVGTRDDLVVALAAETGDTLWSADAGSRPTSPAALSGDRVLVGTDDGELLALGADGSEAFRFTTDDVISTAPSVAGDTVVVASEDGFVYALDVATSDMRWQFDLGREVRGAPSVVDGVVFVAGPGVVAIGGQE